MMRISFTTLLLLLALKIAFAAEPQRKLVSVAVLSPTLCTVDKKEMPCTDLIAYLKHTLHVRAETPIYVSGGSAQNSPALVREVVSTLRDGGFPNSGLAGFIRN